MAFLIAMSRVSRPPFASLTPFGQPNYTSNGLFYTYSSRYGGPGNHMTHVIEHQVSADPNGAT